MQPAENSYEEIEPEQALEQAPEHARSQRRRRGRSAAVYVLALSLSGTALGLGGYAWQLLNEKEKLKSDVAGLERVQAETEQRVARLVEEKGQEQSRSAQATNERDELRVALARANAELAELTAANAADTRQLAELRDLSAKFQRMIDSGALEINVRRGRMIVEMPAAVLFDSGSAELSQAGRETVIQVAKILRNVPRHRFLVAGHTDNVPAVKEYKSNWDLSAARAVRVTETLTSQGVPPQRLVIAGYSEYDPVASNAKEAGRQKNRRIEIILEPYVEQKLVQGLLGETPAAARPKSSEQASRSGRGKP